MLSRSNSNAGDRLRRAKSTSSAHASSSGPRLIPPASDPFIIRQQAEAAAVEAFHRAQPQQEAAYQEYRPVPPKPQRRRSRVSGRAEGSHFEEARLARTRSTNSRKDDSAATKSSRIKPLQQSDLRGSNGEESVITRKRSVIPPNPSARFSQCDYSAPPSSRNVRKSQAGYTDGSPVPRTCAALKERSSTLQLRPNRSEGYESNVQRTPKLRISEAAPVQPAETPKGSTRERPTDEDILALARDKCLQDFQHKKLRERKSFILAPFQKRRATNIQKSSESSYDTSLPPFNYADESPLPPPLPPAPLPPELTIPVSTVQPDRKTRNFSESLKGRFKKVFRKSSRVPSGLPAQHVEGKRFQFSTDSPLSTPIISQDKDEDPFTVHPDPGHLTVPENKLDGSISRQSVAAQSTTKSRVTSWTNSTVAGTWSTRPDDDLQESADENGRLKRSDSVSTLRKAASFFGRPVKNKLRKASKAELQSSEESTGLYSALQERMRPADSASEAANNEDSAQPRTSSALATLPSQQQQGGSTVGSKSRWAAPTIRSVTPDPSAYKLDIPSPVTEVLSPEPIQPASSAHSQRDDQSEPTPRSQLQRRPAVKAPTPSKEQIARRIERSKNRWQSPLDELSPTAPRSTGLAMMEDNPYELRSLSSALNQPAKSTDLPHHAKVGEQPSAVRRDVLSPSVYSRGTDGASPRSDTPVDLGGAMVTITGHEVRSYSISPKKREQPVERAIKGSHEWRRWLSNEMNGWNDSTNHESFALPKRILADAAPANLEAPISKRPSEQEMPELRSPSTSPVLEAPVLNARPQRPRRTSNRSSFMNDRYPMLDTSRNSSNTSFKGGRRISSRPESQPDSADPSPRTSVIGINAGAEGARLGNAATRQRAISKHKSIGHLDSAARRRSGLKDIETNQEEAKIGQNAVKPSAPVETTSTYPDSKSETACRSKSAFNLRANYKTSSGGAKPIAVRRKTENTNDNIHILEDRTIQNISAGPYASQQASVTVTHPDANKENTPPSDTNGLPALSSSEWLAAGTSKRKPSAVHPAYRNRSVSRYSPSRTGNAGSGAGGGGSPGQRLVTNWLDGKRSKENSPVLV